MLIYKEALLNHTGIKELYLPFETVEEAKNNILRIGLQYGFPYMWFDALDKPKKEYLLVCIGTGHEHLEFNVDDYIGSEIVDGGDYVWHYLLVDREGMKKRFSESNKN